MSQVLANGAVVSVAIVVKAPPPAGRKRKVTDVTPDPPGSLAVAATETFAPPIVAAVAGCVNAPDGAVRSTWTVFTSAPWLPPPSTAVARTW